MIVAEGSANIFWTVHLRGRLVFSVSFTNLRGRLILSVSPTWGVGFNDDDGFNDGEPPLDGDNDDDIDKDEEEEMNDGDPPLIMSMILTKLRRRRWMMVNRHWMVIMTDIDKDEEEEMNDGDQE